ncbi:MAG TPA: class I adenylate-forming enzyme family protein [Miltoncostaeaceae bacterium]|nr:class I adenylate-forming enzyme family protein [Miltoncostaeaceae bacterium]
MAIVGSPLAAPAPLHEVLRAGLEARPDAVAMVSSARALTWRDVDEARRRLAAGYAGLGLRPGDRVASLLPNRIDLVIHYLACFAAGLIATPLNYRYTAREIDHALEVSGAAALVVHDERAGDVAESRLAGGLPAGTVWYEGPGAGGPRFEDLAAAPPADPVATDVADPAVIFFTSGSTGPAKGVTHSLETVGWMCASAAAAFELTPGDAFLPGSSMSHLGSFLWTFAALSAGARVVIARSWDSPAMLPLLRAERPTVMAMLPAALTALVRDPDATAADFASLRICRAGSDKVALQLEEDFTRLAGFLIDEGYGMTEVGLATLNPPSGEIRPGSIGRPAPGVAISVRDDAGDEVPPGTVGRIWISTPCRTVGYWGDPQASAAVVRDGWLDSGDLARADEDGYLWFFGRRKQIIVHDGSNITPFEVEDALLEHPGVGLAGVVGVDDAVHGESVRAYVTLTGDGPPPTEAELIGFTRERIGYKAPEEVVILDEMPLNATGKVDRAGLKRVAEEHLHPHGLPR